jgi:hypothetical protein
MTCQYIERTPPSQCRAELASERADVMFGTVSKRRNNTPSLRWGCSDQIDDIVEHRYSPAEASSDYALQSQIYAAEIVSHL